CSARVGSNPILVVKGPQGLVLSFSNEHSRGGHFRDYITSVQLLTFPFSMSGCISIWRWTANPLWIVYCVVFLKRAYEAILGTTSPVSSTFPFWMSGCISIWLYSAFSVLRGGRVVKAMDCSLGRA